MATKQPTTGADHVIAGAGSAGCALAKVLLLEAGRTHKRPLVSVPSGRGIMHSVPEAQKALDWGFTSIDTPHSRPQSATAVSQPFPSAPTGSPRASVPHRSRPPSAR